MSDLQTAAQQALEALMDAQRHNYALKHKETDGLITALRAALAELDGRQQTHSTECWRWHHECAISKIQWMHTPLTDAEIDALVEPWWNSAAIAEVLASNHPAARAAGASVLRHVARAVEKAHGIE